MRIHLAAGFVAVGLCPGTAGADTAEARCDVYPAGSDSATATMPCVFGQRQGHITISRDDGITHDLTPEGDTVGNFRDQDGNTVYRRGDLGETGLIFQFPAESLFLYWGGRAATTGDADNPTAPFDIVEYDATTLLPCRKVEAAEMGSCPAGIARMEDGQASITVEDPDGDQFTVNFMKDIETGEAYVNATNRETEAVLESDSWNVTIDGQQLYQVPLAAITGG